MSTVSHNPPEPSYPVDECESCNAPIIWAVTRNVRRMPVDAEPVDTSTGGGNVLLSREGGRVMAEVVSNPGRLFGRRVYRSHMQTCPFRDRYRHPRAGKGA